MIYKIKKIAQSNIIYLILFFLVIIISIYMSQFFKLPQKHYMSITVEFKELWPITRAVIDSGISVYYRGYKVGEVYDIELSEDQQSILLSLHITYKDLKLPENSSFEIGIENVLGSKFINIIYPQKPSSLLITDGMRVKGKSYSVYKEFEAFIEEEFDKERFSKFLSNTEDLISILNMVLSNNKQEVNNLLKQLNTSGQNVDILLKDVKKLLNNPATQEDITNSLYYASKTLKTVDEILEDENMKQFIKNSPKKLDKTLNNVDSITKNVVQMTGSIPVIGDITQDISKDVKVMRGSFCSNIPYIKEDVNCLSSSMGEMLSQRYLMFKLLFGRPGRCFEKCKNNKFCE